LFYPYITARFWNTLAGLIIFHGADDL